MPILHNDNGASRLNPQAMMLGKEHLRKIMLGGNVVWQRHRSHPPSYGWMLESLAHQGVKLRASNSDNNLQYPMFFPDRLPSGRLPSGRLPDDETYLDRLTFIGRATASLQTIDAMLVADVIDSEMHFPKFFFDNEPEKSTFDYRGNLTFIGNEELE
jgi:hypothetical protein